MNTNISEDIRYSLMAVVPDRRKENLKRLKLLKSKRLLLLEILNNLIKPTKLPEPYETHSYSKYSTTTPTTKFTDQNQLELNLNKFIVKDMDYLNKLENNLTKEDDGNSTDTCSECESSRFNDRFSDDECFEEDSKLNNLYAIKFIPLKEQNVDKSIEKSDVKANEKTTEKSDDKSIDNLINNQENLKTFSKNELIDFYQDYGLKDLFRILNRIDQEISDCDHNLKEETEKRNKFYVDDSRRTHDYNEFITTYLLMLTEQKKLHEFIDAKDAKEVKDSKLITNNLNKQSTKSQDTKHVEDDKAEPVCYKFFKEIFENYEDILMKEDEEDKSKEIDQNTSNSLNSTPLNTSNASINTSNSTPNSSLNASSNQSTEQQGNKRKYTRRSSSSIPRPSSTPKRKC